MISYWYHDDASLLARLIVLSKSYGVYASEAVKRNWQCVPVKSMLSGMWFRQEGRDGELSRSEEDLTLITDNIYIIIYISY